MSGPILVIFLALAGEGQAHSLYFSAESAAIPNTTLEFASLCLKNSLFLLNKACELPEGEEGDRSVLTTDSICNLTFIT